MNEFDALVEGFDGLDADEKQLLAGQIQANSHLAAPDNEIVSHGMTVEDQSTADALDEILGTDEPPHEPDDWPEPEPEVPLFPTISNETLAETAVDLRVLRSDQRPQPGLHYVVFGGKPYPVHRAISQTEDEFVRSQLDTSDTLKDHDGQRRVRADRALRQRYRGYVCGEMRSL